MTERANIVLIGMPAAGKSTVGRLLAERASMEFLDTDRLIERREQRGLREIIERRGTAHFRKLEEQCVLALDARGAVVSTGGSVIYSEPAMRHLDALGLIVFLDAPLEEIESRIADPSARAVVRREGQTLAELFAERRPLYERWARMTVPCTAATVGEVVDRLAAALPGGGPRARPRS